MRSAIIIILIIISSCWLFGQNCRDASVEISATVQNNPPRINLEWISNAGATQYQVYRKLKSSTNWGTVFATLTGTTNQYIDTAVVSGISYEYRVIRTASSYTGYGYINAGIEIGVTENRGILILVVDSTIIPTCETEIERLEDDLKGDGWKVIRHDISPADPVTNIKALIVNDYYQSPANTKAVFLLGHVPVPYSGNINPDGHSDHQGAWPADVYYADIDGIWTDNIVNNTTASDTRNVNVPGDGKFDQSLIPSDAELQIGRVDFNNMPSFTASAAQLIKNYLDKNHDYRHKAFVPVYQALVDDNFGYFGGEAFGSNGWKNFGPLAGNTNVSALDYFTNMASTSYLWSYGCGGGWYQGASGIGNTTNFASSNLQGVFTVLFGSYFGDWDSQNNFLRAPLAQGKMLTNAWSGRPHWQFHHMGLGENIGYCARLTQNNSSTYFASYGARFVHIALMGDPSLRNDVVAPPSNVIASVAWSNCVLSWTASTDSVAGYYIYMKNDSVTDFIRLNQYPVTGLTYTDSSLPYIGTYEYMVKAIKLENHSSGSYYNLSQGINDTAFHAGGNTLTGTITYANIFNTALSGVIVELKDTIGNTIATDTTGLTGQYFFNNLPNGVFNIIASSTNATGGINSTDALFALRHFIHLINLSGLNYEAADVDNSNTINSIDALNICRFFTCMISSFPAGSWYFEPANITITGSGMYSKDIKGICIGDVNGSFEP